MDPDHRVFFSTHLRWNPIIGFCSRSISDEIPIIRNLSDEILIIGIFFLSIFDEISIIGIFSLSIFDGISIIEIFSLSISDETRSSGFFHYPISMKSQSSASSPIIRLQLSFFQDIQSLFLREIKKSVNYRLVLAYS